MAKCRALTGSALKGLNIHVINATLKRKCGSDSRHNDWWLYGARWRRRREYSVKTSKATVSRRRGFVRGATLQLTGWRRGYESRFDRRGGALRLNGHEGTRNRHSSVITSVIISAPLAAALHRYSVEYRCQKRVIERHRARWQSTSQLSV